MDNLRLSAVLAGVFFGVWPLLMNRSGLSGIMSSTVFTAIVLVCLSPFALSSVGQISDANWTMAISAGVVGAFGLYFFNGMLTTATPQQVGSLFVLMIVVQTAIPAMYQVVMTGELTTTRAIGFVLAFVSAVLLTR
jgi:uncharacterized membrane protein